MENQLIRTIYTDTRVCFECKESQSVRAVETATAGVNVFFGVKRYRSNYQ